MNTTLFRSSKRCQLLACIVLCWLVVPTPAQEKATKLGHAETVGTGIFAFSPAAELMVYPAQSTKGKIEWNLFQVSLKTGKQTGKITFPAKLQVTSPAFSKDGKTLAWLNLDGMIVLRDLASGKERSVRYREPARENFQSESLTLSPDLKMAAINGYNKSVHFVDLATGRMSPGERIYEAKEPVIFTPDGKTVYLSHKDSNVVNAFDVSNNKRLRTLSFGAAIGHCALSPDATTMAVTEPSINENPKFTTETPFLKHIFLWDPITNKEKARFRMGPSIETGRNFGAIAFSPDGKTLAYGYQYRQPDPKRDTYLLKPAIGFVDAATGQALADMTVPSVCRSLVFAPDGKSITAQVGFGTVETYAVPAFKAPPKGTTPATDLIVKDSVWVDAVYGKSVITIFERSGETYRGRYVSAYFDREVTGTIKDGKISWLAKDVQGTRGGQGGDHEGIVYADGSIDFVVTEKSGSTKRYSFLLKKGS